MGEARVMQNHLTDSWTTATAAAAVVSPWWLPIIDNISAWAAWLLPILGCAWLFMQMYFKWKEHKRFR